MAKVRFNRYGYLALIATLWHPTLGMANPSKAHHTTQTTRSQSQSVATAHQGLALTQEEFKAWGLNEKDWARYQRVLRSPQGFELQNSSPILALGQTAKTPEARRRFAEMMVRHEYERIEALLAFNREYQAAWQRLYPDLKPIGQRHLSPSAQTRASNHVALFVKSGCPECVSALKAWRAQGKPVDVYLTDSFGYDDALKRWAEQAGLSTSDVRQGLITLNHDTQGVGLTLAKGQPLPISAQNKGGQWQRIRTLGASLP